MKILITNGDLSARAGTQLYVRDVALGLLRRGHSPFVFSPVLGEGAAELRAATIPVVDNLNSLSVKPDVIHGHHHLQTMTALLRFPGVPAVYFCHGWIPWEEAPPRFPRILRYVAVDYASRDRLIFEHGIPENQVKVLLNFVDLERFKSRPPLPPSPKRALIFSNYATEETYIPMVREACRQVGIELDVAGAGVGRPCDRPERVLGNYDIVFAKARAALEAMAVGTAVILCDMGKMGAMVTMSEVDKFRTANFGIRVRQEPVSVDLLVREIKRYDAYDAALVSQHIRQTAGHENVIEEIISIYHEISKEKSDLNGAFDPSESGAVSDYLHWLSPRFKEYYKFRAKVELLQNSRLMFLYDFLWRLPLIKKWAKRKRPEWTQLTR